MSELENAEINSELLGQVYSSKKYSIWGFRAGELLLGLSSSAEILPLVYMNVWATNHISYHISVVKTLLIRFLWPLSPMSLADEQDWLESAIQERLALVGP